MFYNLILEKALTEFHDNFRLGIGLIDYSAYLSLIPIISSIFEENSGNLSTLKGAFDKDIDLKENRLHFKPKMIFSETDGVYQCLVFSCVATFNLSANTADYPSAVFGENNNSNRMKSFFENKPSTLILPFDVVSTCSKTSIPQSVGIQRAMVENPLHKCFKHTICPSPCSGRAVNNNLAEMVGYVVHQGLLEKALDTKPASSQQSGALLYDTKLALEFLKSDYDIEVNEDVIAALKDFDDQLLLSGEKGGVSFIDVDLSC